MALCGRRGPPVRSTRPFRWRSTAPTVVHNPTVARVESGPRRCSASFSSLRTAPRWLGLMATRRQDYVLSGSGRRCRTCHLIFFRSVIFSSVELWFLTWFLLGSVMWIISYFYCGSGGRNLKHFVWILLKYVKNLFLLKHEKNFVNMQPDRYENIQRII
jgi:hypothetical protein